MQIVEIVFKGSKIFYEVVGKGSATVFLCGWGYGSEVLKPLAKCVKGKKVFLDFPMFGRSEGLKEDWCLEDYAKLVFEVLKQEKISKAKFLGHSFGGKVAILVSCKYNITESLVLVASAGIKPRFSLSQKIAVQKYKLAKKFGKDLTGFGSEDYQALDDGAKKTFVSIVNTHVEKYCKQVLCPVLIVAGRFDDATPLYMQKKFAKLFKSSITKIFDGGHFVWVDDFVGVSNAICRFLNKEET